MTTVDNVIAKNKMINYVEKAKNIDDLVIICQKFLEKYKPEVVTVPMSAKEVEVITASVRLNGYTNDIEFEKSQVMRYLAEELFKSKFVEYKKVNMQHTYEVVITARIGVCKP